MVDLSVNGLLDVFARFLLIGLIFLVAMYIYSSMALMAIAKRTNTPNAWLAWIPIANMLLMTEIAGVQWWTLLIVLFSSFIPAVGFLISLGIFTWWYWKICEVRRRPGWWSLITLIPVVGWVWSLILLGILAWGE